MDALKDSDMSVEEKKRMGEMLQRLEIENPADSDDEYSDDEQSLAERLQGVDLDADPDVVWERLTESERLEFAQILKSENLGMLVPSWKPWWMQHDAELIEVVKQEGLDSISLGSSQSSTSVPKAISSIPKLSEILKNNEPSPLVVYDIINVIFSYSLLIRFYNGEVTEFTIELAQHLLDISQALSANKNYTSTEEAVHSAIEHVTKNLKEAGNQRLNCLQDVTHILLGKSPSHPLDYVEGALSDCWRIASSAKKSVAKDSSQKQFQKQLFGCKKKLEFHLAWAAEFLESFKIAAIEVQCLHRTLLQEEQLQRKVESSFDTKIRKKHSETKPSKLIEEITK
ncbi:zinc finger HIT domain-containing protein 2-like isoform X2 [Apostichopus japonicus]